MRDPWIKCSDQLPPYDQGERVLIYTEGVDFAGEQFFDVKADDLWNIPHPEGGEEDPRPEVCQAATHWMPRPFPSI